MKRICDCKEFSENMPRLDNATMSAFIHGVQLGPDFVYFKYCPWCGKLMHYEKEKIEQVHVGEK